MCVSSCRYFSIPDFPAEAPRGDVFYHPIHILFLCTNPEHGCGFQVQFSQHTLSGIQIHMTAVKTNLRQNLLIPGRANFPADVHRQGNVCILPCHFTGHTYMSIGTVGSNRGVLGAFTADVLPIVRVKIQQNATRTQNPKPFLVGFFRVRKGPSQIPADDHIKALIIIA